MEANTILFGALSLGSLGFIMGALLIFAHRKIALSPNETIKKLEDALPNINCGACGYPGCAAYAEAIVEANAPLNLCAPGGEEITRKIASILGAEVPDLAKKIAYIRCQGKIGNAALKYEYHGILECSQAELLFAGAKVCEHGCIGLGSCFRACPFGAIEMHSDMLVRVNPHKCTGCGLCVSACPRGLITLIPFREKPAVYQVACRAKENALETRDQCQVGCIGCGLCVEKCPVKAIQLKDNLAEIQAEKCVGCGACEKVCPTKAITYIKKEKHHFF